MFAFLSAPIDTPPSLGSLASIQLCGLDDRGRGTYTTEGINKLCEGLKGSAVTSLKCAAPECSLFVSAPVDTLALSHLIHSAPRSQSFAQQPHQQGQTGAQRRRGQRCSHPLLAATAGCATPAKHSLACVPTCQRLTDTAACTPLYAACPRASARPQILYRTGRQHLAHTFARLARAAYSLQAFSTP